ncbi:MAG: 30S ribosomal protein S17 [Candidatus Magnetoglobus multicellularis str. Araruama]|uniref:Small ribosomal subunit protein uS17 n=1 Tax=Candidatus Magnetoglobus multicellularis str. Araruama TaxID=890399 RepID=A0A1V1PIF5_9BACT|nr:MAG: 30S ribosomal protein S17 [Candidatus Magnetoglobus multicellularis str. Araruama]
MNSKSRKRKLVGVVVSNKMQKTIVVQVDRLVKHPLYKKFLKRKSKFYAHDHENACTIGDTVMIMECRPLSKQKRWRMVEILKKAV